MVKTFLRLIETHFPLHHKLNKAFNRSNLKISYSCKPNVKLIVNKDNKTVEDLPTNIGEKTYNCKNKDKFLLQESCLTNSIIQEATLTSNQDTYKHKIFYGITETKFKQRYTNHIKSFRHERYQSEIGFSNKLWSIKRNNYTPRVVWEIFRKHQLHNPKILLVFERKT